MNLDNFIETSHIQWDDVSTDIIDSSVNRYYNSLSYFLKNSRSINCSKPRIINKFIFYKIYIERKYPDFFKNYKNMRDRSKIVSYLYKELPEEKCKMLELLYRSLRGRVELVDQLLYSGVNNNIMPIGNDYYYLGSQNNNMLSTIFEGNFSDLLNPSTDVMSLHSDDMFLTETKSEKEYFVDHITELWYFTNENIDSSFKRKHGELLELISSRCEFITKNICFDLISQDILEQLNTELLFYLSEIDNYENENSIIDHINKFLSEIEERFCNSQIMIK